jgi:hypothetical protein
VLNRNIVPSTFKLYVGAPNCKSQLIKGWEKWTHAVWLASESGPRKSWRVEVLPLADLPALHTWCPPERTFLRGSDTYNTTVDMQIRRYSIKSGSKLRCYKYKHPFKSSTYIHSRNTRFPRQFSKEVRRRAPAHTSPCHHSTRSRLTCKGGLSANSYPKRPI